MTAVLAMTPTTGAPGDTESFTVSGFRACRTVRLYRAGNVELDEVTTSATGSGSGSFTIPSLAPGRYRIKAIDGTLTSPGRVAYFVLTISPVYTFSEEFGAALDPDKWKSNYKPSGLPQAQKDPALVSVSGGYGRLRAEKRSNGLWYSSSIDTKPTPGRTGFKQKYGLFVVRAKACKGRGLWPAAPWSYDDATSQEIDGMEILANPVGTRDADHDVQALHCTVHWTGAQADQDGTPIHTGVDLSLAFHEYGFLWRADRIDWLFDGSVVKSVTNPAHIPTVQLPVIADLGVTGWAGPTDSTTPNPSEFLLDWVHVSA